MQEFGKMRIISVALLLLILSLEKAPVDGARIMFYIPFCAKSATGTIPILADALIQRGHNVTIGKQLTDSVQPFCLHSFLVTPWKNMGKMMGFDSPIGEIIVQSNYGQLCKDLSTRLLSGRPLRLPEVFSGAKIMYANAIETNSDALAEVKKGTQYLRMVVKMFTYSVLVNQTYDMVLTSALTMGHEVGYYLAHRYGATLGLYSTFQQSLTTMNKAMGQPHHTGYMPAPFMRVQ